MFRLLCRVLFVGVLLCPFVAAARTISAACDFCGMVPVKVKQLKVYEYQSMLRGSLIGSQLVIRDEAAWKKHVTANPGLAKLKVDFGTQMVLVYGEKPQGWGKQLASVKVEDSGKELRVVLHFRLGLPWEPQLQDLIWPNHVIVVERSEKSVQFFEEFNLADGEGISLAQSAQPETTSATTAQPKLTIAIDGANLVVSTMVTANNSPHALQTSFQVDGKGRVHLKYVLIQNSDLLVRSQKQVKVTWRLKGMAIIPSPAFPFSYHVEGTKLALSTVELSGLLPQLADLKQAGEKFLNTVKICKDVN